MNKSIKILVAHHKQGLIIKSDEYLPIHVGKSLHKDLDLGIQGDNDGENISDENLEILRAMSGDMAEASEDKSEKKGKKEKKKKEYSQQE